MMERVYICSPFWSEDGGVREQNLVRARALCAYAASEGYAPFASHIAYTQFLYDGDPRQRELGLAMGRAWIPVCAQFWIYAVAGITDGMRGDMDEALRCHLPIVPLPWDCGACEEVRSDSNAETLRR